MILNTISFILVFGVLVFIHELGHFMAARALKVKVHEFALGIGPVLIARQGKETKYSVRAFPIGGYVKLEGEDASSDSENGLMKRSPLQRIFLFAAGAIMNFVLAIVLLWAIYAMVGMPSDTSSVGNAYENYPAYEAGIRPGDKITEVNGVPTQTWSSLTDSISKSSGPVQLKVARDGQVFEVSVVPVAEGGRAKIGIEQMTEKSIAKALPYSIGLVGNISKQILLFVANIPTTGVKNGDVMGPVGMFQLIGNAASSSAMSVLYLTAILSINLGIFNLLPFPALDGGRIIIALVEIVRRKPVDPKKEGIFHLVGLVLLLGLMILLVISDAAKLVR